MANGPYRKIGCGRKALDSEMEKRLSEYCLFQRERGIKLRRKEIRSMALRMFKKDANFKASKGWTDKFVRKYNLFLNKKRNI